jgi:hypothetical protein
MDGVKNAGGNHGRGNSGRLTLPTQLDRTGRRDSPPQPGNPRGHENFSQSGNNKSSLVGELNTQTQQVVNRFLNPSGQQRQSTSQLRQDATENRPNQFLPDTQSNIEGHVPRGNAYGRQINEQSQGHELNRDANGRTQIGDSTVLQYLRGQQVEGKELPPQIQHALDTLTSVMNRNAINNLVSEQGAQGEAKVEKFVERAVEYLNRTSERLNQTGHEASHSLQQTVEDLAGAIQLGKYFARAEQTGGSSSALNQAEEMVLRFLYGDANNRSGEARPLQGEGRAMQAAELLRDLRAGVFLPTQESLSPFPLTGRARIVNEMMELMHTLEAIERALQDPSLQVKPATAGKGEAGAMLGGREAGALGAEHAFEELLTLLPTLPGRAGREEMARILAAFKGAVTDAEGRTLLAKDGTALKLDHLLWLNTAGSLLGKSFAAGTFQTQLSPLIVYGFDAVFSLIGFDGRTLSPPHFAAVQSQINGSEMEWVFGQPPLSEGWMRALIERLKDSGIPDHNSLGEMLEESLAGGRFHAVLMQGSVHEGEAVKDSFNISKLLPGASVETAFAPA